MEIYRVDNNELTKLPEFNSNVINIYCYNNRLTELPQLPPNLVKLYCGKNLLTQLPHLPHTLSHLSIYSNPLLIDKPLPSSLIEIWLSPWQIHSVLNNLSNTKTEVLIYN
jgi:hypothetical protein